MLYNNGPYGHVKPKSCQVDKWVKDLKKSSSYITVFFSTTFVQKLGLSSNFSRKMVMRSTAGSSVFQSRPRARHARKLLNRIFRRWPCTQPAPTTELSFAEHVLCLSATSTRGGDKAAADWKINCSKRAGCTCFTRKIWAKRAESLVVKASRASMGRFCQVRMWRWKRRIGGSWGASTQDSICWSWSMCSKCSLQTIRPSCDNWRTRTKTETRKRLSLIPFRCFRPKCRSMCKSNRIGDMPWRPWDLKISFSSNSATQALTWHAWRRKLAAWKEVNALK